MKKENNYPGRKEMRVPILCSVSPDTKKFIRELSASQGMSPGEVIDHLTRWFKEDSEKK